jgi:hypothetical protein
MLNPRASDWAYSNLRRKRSKRLGHENEERNSSLRFAGGMYQQ